MPSAESRAKRHRQPAGSSSRRQAEADPVRPCPVPNTVSRAFRRGPRFLRVLLLALTCLALAEVPNATAQRAESGGVLSRAEALSYFLLNCAYFGQWPSGADPQTTRELRIGLLGKDVLGPALDRTATKATATWFKDGRVSIERGAKPDRLEEYHVVFCSGLEAGELKSIIARYQGKPILWVSEVPGAAEAGSTIGVRIEQERLVFDLNLDQLTASQVELGSKMKKRATAFIRGGKREANPYREGGGP